MTGLDLTTGQSIAGLAVVAVFGVMAVCQSLRPRIRRTTADEQALNACIRRHPSNQPARIPGPRRHP